MKNLAKNLLLLLALALPAMALAQPQSCKVKFSGSKPTIIDFARAYCSQSESGSFNRDALAAFAKGNHKKGNVECIVDKKNGYLRYTAPVDMTINYIEMCYWTCDNKNECIFAVNLVDTSMDFDESNLTFYRYNAKTRVMKLIKPPFDRQPQPIDLVNKSKAAGSIVNMVQGARNEDSNRFQPCYELPRTGKDITCRIGDRKAIPREAQRKVILKWNGSGFNME